MIPTILKFFIQKILILPKNKYRLYILRIFSCYVSNKNTLFATCYALGCPMNAKTDFKQCLQDLLPFTLGIPYKEYLHIFFKWLNSSFFVIFFSYLSLMQLLFNDTFAYYIDIVSMLLILLSNLLSYIMVFQLKSNVIIILFLRAKCRADYFIICVGTA